ncbi:MAG: hypothetical protein AVDCRST_MAG56-2142 [uncultured Cytophagales bacterium]|uniref:Uncharacterized protein n=1 Tax=uncultured Cytophagales bacterium TaxID=158755 RepID=A0A6J4IK30_9SPHI|nr:MAG: hypothetical protein AVDCRST_MAG56-2142 [uncultured Cytophagales bacterium]
MNCILLIINTRKGEKGFPALGIKRCPAEFYLNISPPSITRRDGFRLRA